MRWKRWIVPVLIVAAVAGALVWGLRPQPAVIEAAEVARGPLRVMIEEEGRTRLKERYVVFSPIAGRMDRIPLHEGDPIRAGQRLTEVAPQPAIFLDTRSRAQGQAAVATAEAMISAAREREAAAKSNADYWAAEAERIRKLAESGDVARSRYDQAHLEQQRAAAALREARAAVVAERAGLRRTMAALEQPSGAGGRGEAGIPVTAPVSGRVLRLVRDSAGPVGAGEPLVEIGNARAIEVEVELLSSDAVKVAPGTRVIFTRWGGEQDLLGVVRQIEPSGRTKVSALGVEEQRVPVIVDLTSPETEWRGLGAGYRVEAGFVLWEEEDVLQIPGSAVFRDKGEAAVFVIEGGAARRRRVELGRRAGLRVQVLSGIEAGQRIVAHPDGSIEDGAAVSPR